MTINISGCFAMLTSTDASCSDDGEILVNPGVGTPLHSHTFSHKTILQTNFCVATPQTFYNLF